MYMYMYVYVYVYVYVYMYMYMYMYMYVQLNDCEVHTRRYECYVVHSVLSAAHLCHLLLYSATLMHEQQNPQ